MKPGRTTTPLFPVLGVGFRQPFIVLMFFFLVLQALLWPLYSYRFSPSHDPLRLASVGESFLPLVVSLFLYSLYFRGTPYYLFGRLQSARMDLLMLPAILAVGDHVLQRVIARISPVFELPSYSRGYLTSHFIPGDLLGMWLSLTEVATDAAFQEVLFRGLIMASLLALTRRPWFAIIAQGCLFAVVNGFDLLGGVSFAPAFLLRGFLFGYFAFIRRSLWPVIVTHVLADSSIFFFHADPDFNLVLRTLQWLGLLK